MQSPSPIFCVMGKGNEPRKPFHQGTVMMLQDNYKMIYYFGYPMVPEGNEYIEFYDMDKDPEELENLYDKGHPIAAQMREHIIERLNREDAPYK